MATCENFVAAFENIGLYKEIFYDCVAENIDRKSAAKKIAYIYENFLSDGRTAVEWLKEAVVLGDKNSRFKIAEIFRDGRGVEADGARAVMWFSKILNDTDSPDHERYAAAFEIGKMFHEGRAVPPSDTTAVKYFALSAKAGVVTARVAYNTLAKIYSCGDEIAPNIEMTLHWLQKAIEVGSNRAAWNVAKIFRDGKFGVNQNGEKALEILRVPASKKFDVINKVAALRMIAEIYDKGLGVPEDKEKAANLYQEAARINDEWINAINNLQMRA